MDQPFRVHSAKDIGAAIRYFRTHANMSQAELAERAGVHRTYLSDLERGRATEAQERVIAILSELGVRVTLGRADW